MKSIRKTYIALALAAMFSVVFLIATYGTALLSTPFASVELNVPSAADSNKEFSVIADSDSRRVLILNADGYLTGTIDCNTFDSPVEAVTDVCVSEDLVYVAGLRYAPDSSEITEERVAVYDKGGNLQRVVFELKGESEEAPTIKGLDGAPGGVVVAYNKIDANASLDNVSTVRFIWADGDESRELETASSGLWSVYDASYAYDVGNYAILSTRGILNDESDEAGMTFSDHVFTSIDLNDEGILYACDDVTGALCVLSDNGATVRQIIEGDRCSSVSASDGIITACSKSGNRVYLCEPDGTIIRDFTSIAPSAGYSARMVLVWICSLYLATLVIVLLVRRLRRAIAAGRTESIGPMLASVAVLVMIGLVVGNLSFSSYRTSIDTRTNEIDMCADYLASTAHETSAAMERCNDRYLFREDGKADNTLEDFISVIAKASGIVSSANSNNIGIYFILYGKDEHGVFSLFDSLSERTLGMSASSFADDDALTRAFDGMGAVDDTVLNGHSLRDETRYRFVQIPSSDGKGVAGVIEIGSRMRSLGSSLAADAAQRVLALLVMALVVYLTYAELRECGRCLFAYRRLQEDRADDAIAVLTRPFTFSITILASIDAVMTVLIARDLLMGIGMGNSGALLALPAVMLGVGLITGQALYGLLGSRVGLRRLMIGGAIAMLVCAGFAAASVLVGSFWFYCVAKLAMSVPFGLLYTLGYSLPRAAESDAVRKTAAGGVRRTDTSAAALGTVLGGYVAQALGNAWVYVIVAIACLPIIIMAANWLAKGTPPPEVKAAATGAHRGVLSFVKTPVALAVALLVVLPATVAAGYASFLFPLFSIDLGLSKTDINNIYVLGQLVVYVCISSIDAAEARFGKWRLVAIAVASLGLVFLLFSLNTTIVWSILVIALVALSCKTADGWKALWLYAAREFGVSAGHATSAMFAVRSLARVAQPFILGALLAATDSVAVIVIGAFCIVCAAGFFFATRRTTLVNGV